MTNLGNLKPLVVIDFHESRRKELFDELQKTNPDVSTDEITRHLDTAWLRSLPHNWKEVNSDSPIRPFYPDGEHDLNNPQQRFGFDSIHVRAVQFRKPDVVKRTKAVELYAEENPHVRSIVEDIEGWGRPTSLRSKKETVKYDGQRFLQWTSEVILMAYQNPAYSRKSMPMAGWRVKTQLLVPLKVWKHGDNKKDQLPIIRFELCDVSNPSNEPVLEEALFESIESMVSSLATELDDVLADSHYESTFNLEVYLPSETLVFAFERWFRQQYDSESHSRLEPDFETYQCLVFAGNSPKADLPKPRKFNNDINEFESFETIQLVVFELNNIVIIDDLVYRDWELNTRDALREAFGCSPEQILKDFGFNQAEYDDWCKDDEGDDYLNGLVDYDDGNFYALKHSLEVRNVPSKKGKHPTVTLLVNPATKKHVCEIHLRKPNMASFLKEGIAHFKSENSPIKAIKIPLSLEKEHPKLKCAVDSLDVIRPTSGVDAGSRYSGLWRDTVDRYYWSSKKIEQGHRLAWPEFVDTMKDISKYLNGLPNNLESDMIYVKSAFPASLHYRPLNG